MGNADLILCRGEVVVRFDLSEGVEMANESTTREGCIIFTPKKRTSSKQENVKNL